MENKELIKDIRDQINNQKNNEYLEINLNDNLKNNIPELIKSELEKYTNIQILCLNNCSLKNLDNLPNIPSLLRLELDNNMFPVNELNKLVIYQKLISLSIFHNPMFNNFDELKKISGNLKQIQQMDFFGCPIVKEKFYRKKLFSMFLNLRLLDNLDRKGNENSLED